MYNSAKKKLQQEIKEREKTIKEIDNFDNLNLYDKFELIKKCYLRYEREKFPDILKDNFISTRLKNGYAYLGTNYFIIEDEDDNFSFSASLSTYNHIEIESENKLSNLEYKLKHLNMNIDSKEYSASMIERYLQKPSLSSYKSVSYNYQKNKIICFVEHFMFRKKNINKLKDIYAKISTNINKLKQDKSNIKAEIEKQKQSNNKYLKDIEKDIDYFKNKGYEIKIKF